MEHPKLVLLFSGKRKSGKDYFCGKLKSLIGDKCSVIRISEPLKRVYANSHNLDLRELLSDGPYKEKYRTDMIKWSDEERVKNPGIFCKAACDEAPDTLIWIVSDVRRKTDIEWFKSTYKDAVKTIRITADVGVREKRGYIFTEGVDDVCSECDLDDYNEWDIKITNNSSEECEVSLQKMINFIQNFIL